MEGYSEQRSRAEELKVWADRFEQGLAWRSGNSAGEGEPGGPREGCLLSDRVLGFLWLPRQWEQCDLLAQRILTVPLNGPTVGGFHSTQT